MIDVRFDKAFSAWTGHPLGNLQFWVEKKMIPIGTLKPYEMYIDDKGNVNIPWEDIVNIKFDPIDIPFTQRKLLNILILGASGDGKSLLMKVIWWILHKAKYYCIYVDPKSTDSGRAKVKWDSPRIPPNIEPEGIRLEHYMPIWAMKNFEHLAHNFRSYSTRLKKINEVEMWMGLGMREIAASKVNSIINNVPNIAIADLKRLVNKIENSELPAASQQNAIRVLTKLEYSRVVDEKVQELNMMYEWLQGKSICLSYNSASKILMTFDIGHKIYQSMRYTFTHDNSVPIMWLLDDGSYYARDFPEIVRHNLAKEQVTYIGINYRSLGLNNVLSVQSLGIIDENIAETYKHKIISPMFAYPESLSKIGIPSKAIYYLKKDLLLISRKDHLLQYMLIDDEKNVTPFFLFTPACNHFREIYHPKRDHIYDR